MSNEEARQILIRKINELESRIYTASSLQEIDALNIAVRDIDKQIPKKPKSETITWTNKVADSGKLLSVDEDLVWCCPVCGEMLVEWFMEKPCWLPQYCSCGQAILWEDKNESK